MTRLWTCLLALGMCVSLGFAQQGEAEGDAKEEQKPAPEGSGLQPRVMMETTLGDIVLQLNAEKAPITTQNFLQYVEKDFYEGTIFHRVIPNFMIQGGGFTAEMEKKDGLLPPIKNEWRNGLTNKRGTIAMARLGGQPDSATSQFFINVTDNGQLDRPQRDGAAYCVFGRVVEGMNVVDKIRNTDVHKHPKYPSPRPVTPVDPVVIKSVAVIGGYDEQKLNKRVEELEAKEKAAEEKRKAAQEAMLKETIEKMEQESGKSVQETDSGLRYVVLSEGDGESPSATNTVKVHYTGWLLDGTKFDSSVDRGQPASFRLNGVIKGWTEGVQLMKEGAKYKFLIPPELGYGERGAPPRIPPNAPLLFEVELLEVN